jgi:hypothetical protein
MKKVTRSPSQCEACPKGKRSLPEGDQVTSIILFLLFSFLFASAVYAVEIEPMRLEYSLQSGKTYSGTFKLRNSSSSSVDVFSSTGEYRYIFSRGVTPPKTEKRTLPSCSDWLQFEKTEFRLSPGMTIDAKFTIKVPKEAKEEHLCAVLFDEKIDTGKVQPNQETGSVQIQLTPRFSIPVYISIKNTEKLSAQINNMSVVSEAQKGQLIINLTLENTGNVHIRPFGTLVILDENSEVVKDIPIGRSLPVFPGYKETIPVICPKMPVGKYSAIATVEIASDKIIQKKITFEYPPAI